MIKNQRKQGITLISLVITIIILLILATVTINAVLDSNGLFRKAEEAITKYNYTVAKEEVMLAYTNSVTNSYFDNSVVIEDDMEVELKKEDSDANVELKNSKYIIKYKGYDFIIDGTSNNTDSNDYELADIADIPDIEELADLDDEVPTMEHKDLSNFPDYIPIYTAEQFEYINYHTEREREIYDLNNTYVGTYTFSKDKKYVLMNDIEYIAENKNDSVYLGVDKGTIYFHRKLSAYIKFFRNF